MRILFLVDSLGIGGLPNYVLYLAQALQEHEETVAVGFGGKNAPDYLNVDGIELLPLPYDYGADKGDLDEIAKLVQGWRPDVIHIHLFRSAKVVRRLQELGLPMVRSFHDYTSFCLRMGRRRFPGDRCHRTFGWSCLLFGCLIGRPRGGRFPIGFTNFPEKMQECEAYRSLDLSIATSRHIERSLIKNHFPPEKIAYVVNFSRFDAQAHLDIDRLPAGEGAGQGRPLRFLFAGQAVKGKGLEVFIRALSMVKGNWEMTAVSSGPREAPAKALAEKLKISDRISFHSWVPQDEVADFYARADLFVFPSIWDEPAGLAGIEAMSFATPVAAFAVGGLTDYVIDGETGYLSYDVSSAGLALILQKALDRPEALKEMGHNARMFLRKNQSKSKHMTEMKKIYKNMICSKKELADNEIQSASS